MLKENYTNQETQIILNHIGEKIRRARRSHNLSQAEVSLRTGINQSYLSHIEGGTANFTMSVLVRLCAELNIYLPELFAGVDYRGTVLEEASKNVFALFTHTQTEADQGADGLSDDHKYLTFYQNDGHPTYHSYVEMKPYDFRKVVSKKTEADTSLTTRDEALSFLSARDLPFISEAYDAAPPQICLVDQDVSESFKKSDLDQKLPNLDQKQPKDHEAEMDLAALRAGDEFYRSWSQIGKVVENDLLAKDQDPEEVIARDTGKHG